MREAAEAAQKGEFRRGSNARRSYTARQKLKVLEVYDAIWGDPTILRKIPAFNKDPRSMGVPYSTVSGKWSDTDERARLATAASKEHRHYPMAMRTCEFYRQPLGS